MDTHQGLLSERTANFKGGIKGNKAIAGNKVTTSKKRKRNDSELDYAMKNQLGKTTAKDQ